VTQGRTNEATQLVTRLGPHPTGNAASSETIEKSALLLSCFAFDGGILPFEFQEFKLFFAVIGFISASESLIRARESFIRARESFIGVIEKLIAATESFVCVIEGFDCAKEKVSVEDAESKSGAVVTVSSLSEVITCELSLASGRHRTRLWMVV
jgi:hypothetical protein